MNRNVVLAYATATLPKDSRLSGRLALVEKLRQHDISTSVSLEGEKAFTASGLHVHNLGIGRSGEALTIERLIGVATLGLIVNRLDRSIGSGGMVPAQLPPMINENKTRQLAWRKERVHNEVLGPLQLDMPTALIESPDDIATFLDTQEDSPDRFIVKSRHGNLGKGMRFVGRQELVEVFKDDPSLYGKRVVQPAYDFSGPFPTTLRPYDAASREAFEGWNVPNKTKELRVYGFHDVSGTAVFPAARTIENGDNWFFIDPDSLPTMLVRGTQAAIAKAAEISEAPALYGALDFGYGSQGDEAPTWKAIELNALAPYMIGYDKHADVADRLRTMFADQINRTIQEIPQ